jgi:quercetin dioxygenase-like cupin family protein
LPQVGGTVTVMRDVRRLTLGSDKKMKRLGRISWLLLLSGSRIAAQTVLMGMLCIVANPSPVPEMVQEAKVTPLMTKDLAGVTGKEAAMLTVEYAPGASSSKHRHNANTFVYVLEGSIVMQVEGGNAVTLGPGQTFYESPDDVHVVSKNASNTQPARFLVFFVKDKGAMPLVPVK